MKNNVLSNGFRLISLELAGHKIFKNRIKYKFQDDLDVHDKLYTTVIIGPNGTGKSNLLRVLIELFRELSHLKQDLKRTYEVDGQFSLIYDFEGDRYEYSNIEQSEKKPNQTMARKVVGKRAYYLKNGDQVDFYDIRLPKSIVANSIMLTDKYPVLRNDKEKGRFPIYHYLGVKNRPQTASTRSYVRKTVEFVVEKMAADSFRDCLNRISSFLDISGSVYIEYRTKNTGIFFFGNLKPKFLKSFFYDIKRKYDTKETQAPFKLDYFLGIADNEQLIREICNYCNQLKDDDRLFRIPRSSSKLLRFDIVNNSEHKRLKEEYELLEHLRKLGMITTPEIKLDDSDEYNLAESSSGQYHFFSSMIGLVATVQPNSLIFIDEPEISLHPNWQMQYLSFLRELLGGKMYRGCHVVIATHSHFLISDLKGKSSNIIGLKKTSNRIEKVNLPRDLDTFGWSAEEVLYKIFGVITTRNYYIESELRELLHLIAVKSKKKDRARSILERLEKINLSDIDPLEVVIDRARKYLND